MRPIPEGHEAAGKGARRAKRTLCNEQSDNLLSMAYLAASYDSLG
jgi:hypothetical protein